MSWKILSFWLPTQISHSHFIQQNVYNMLLSVEKCKYAPYLVNQAKCIKVGLVFRMAIRCSASGFTVWSYWTWSIWIWFVSKMYQSIDITISSLGGKPFEKVSRSRRFLPQVYFPSHIIFISVVAVKSIPTKSNSLQFRGLRQRWKIQFWLIQDWLRHCRP